VAGSQGQSFVSKGTSPTGRNQLATELSTTPSSGGGSSSGSSSSESAKSRGVTQPGSDGSSEMDDMTFQERERRAAELFAVVADLTLMDQPLCKSCTDKVMREMKEELEILQKEAKMYEECSSRMEQTVQTTKTEHDLEAEAEALKQREAELRDELHKIAQEKLLVQQERVVAEQRRRKLKELELKYWERFCYHQRKLLQQEEAAESKMNSIKN